MLGTIHHRMHLFREATSPTHLLTLLSPRLTPLFLHSTDQEKKLSPDEYSTGTFTISNLGMFGVSNFVSILPPGQGAIMAVAASTPTAVIQKNGMMGMVKQMTVTVTADHRHIYGADVALFLKDLAKLIEEDTQTLLL